MIHAVDENEVARLRSMPYDAYLQTPHWRRRRDAAIRAAGYRCRCGARRELQVHHRTYARLGAELETDLEVLCRSCHEAHHFDESRRQHFGIYYALVAETLKRGMYPTIADLSAAVKDACAAIKIPYDGEKIARAIQLVERDRRHAITPSTPVPSAGNGHAPSAPTGHQEACDILKRLGIVVPFKSMPAVPFGTDLRHAP
jgi:hypothetical protein